MYVPAASGDCFVECKIFAAFPSHIYIHQLSLTSKDELLKDREPKQLSISDKA